MSFENMEVGSGSEGTSAPIGQISFDDVENVVEKVEAEEKAEAKAEKQEIAKVAEKVAEKVAKKLESKDEEVESNPSDSAAQEVVKAKPVKAYDGDKEVELNPDLEIEYKVDGRVEKMKLADVRNEISGKTNWDRKNNEFFQTKKKFDDQVKFVNEQVNSILKMAQEKPEAALFELARLAGKSPDEYAQMLAGTMEGAARWSDMTDAEKRATMAEAENVGYKAEAERRKNMEEMSRAEEARVTAINSLAKDLELSDDDISGLTLDLQNHASVVNPSAEHIYTAWVFKNTMEAFNSNAPEALKSNPSLFNEASQVMLSNGIRSKQDIEQIIKQAYGEEDSARKVGKKIASSQAPKTASAATGSQKKLEVVSFDDI